MQESNESGSFTTHALCVSAKGGASGFSMHEEAGSSGFCPRQEGLLLSRRKTKDRGRADARNITVQRESVHAPRAYICNNRSPFKANVSFAASAGSQIATASATLTAGNQLPRAQTTYFPLSTVSSLVHPRDGMLARSRRPTTVTTRSRHVSSRRVEAVRTHVHAWERIVDDRVLQRIVDGTIAFFRGAIYGSGIISLSPKRKRFRRGVPLLGLWRTSLLLLLLLRGELKQS